MAYRAKLSEAAKGFVESLAEKEPSLARELALLLLSLENDPEPPGSRELVPSLTSVRKEERVWEHPPFVILYLVSKPAKIVEIGMVERY